MARTSYITVAPAKKNGKWLIFARRLGSRERYSPFAEAVNEIAADLIVRTLNANVAALVAGTAEAAE